MSLPCAFLSSLPFLSLPLVLPPSLSLTPPPPPQVLPLCSEPTLDQLESNVQSLGPVSDAVQRMSAADMAMALLEGLQPQTAMESVRGRGRERERGSDRRERERERERHRYGE